ncbi:MAG: hypothetical protein K8F36_04745 [Melioribacteraceae bacterium]|nr:hypothetical protein [Melioribacteraceae bacterium]MCO6472855.1 hypothetical protein [Melioribacteraceae bacterium]MDD3559143.1 hypothetical protein [Melioribacteraceae bacterium]
MTKDLRTLNNLFIGLIALYGGALLSHILSVFAFFEPGELILNQRLTDSDLFGMFYLVGVTKNLALFLGALSLLLFILFIAKSRLNLRLNGWLFISVILFLFIVSFEIYSLIKYDIKMINQVFFGQEYDLRFEIIKNKISSLSALIPIHFFSIIAIFYMFITRPFTKNEA